MSDVKYIVTADTKGATTQIKKVDKSIDGMKQQAQKSISPLKGMFKQLATGLGAAVGIGLAFKKLTGFLKDSVDAAKAQELAEKGMTDALSSTGREVPINAEHFKRYARELQRATTFGDEQILSAQSLLIQLTNLDRDGLDAATKGSLGLATVFKTDLKSATNLVAKALAGNYGALSRYGISVKDLNTDEDKRASLLQQLGTLYERSKGETETYEGALGQLKNTFGDTTEKIGDTIVKSEEFRGTVQLIQETLANFVDSGAMDNWASKLDLVIKNIPIFNQLKTSLTLINADLALQAAELKKAEEAGEAWYDWLKTSNAELKIFGVDVYEGMRKLAGFKEETEETHPIIETMATVIETEVHPALGKLIDKIQVLKNIQPVLKDTFEEAIPPARTFANIVLENVQPSLESTERKTEETTKKMKSLWNDMADGLKTKWASTYGDMFKSWDNLKNGWKNLLGDMYDQFTDIIGQMLAKWTTDLVGGLLKSFSGSTGGILSGITGGGGGGAVGGIGGLAAGAAGATPWGAIAMGAGAFFGTLLGGGGGPSSTDSWHFREIWKNTLTLYAIHDRQHEIRDYARETSEHTAILTEGIPRKLDIHTELLRGIKRALEGSVSAQGGFYGTLTKDTTIRAHRGEEVAITPRHGRGRSLFRNTKLGYEKVHERAIIKGR